LREVKEKGPDLAGSGALLVDDPDLLVRQQASTTLRSLPPVEPVEIPPERIAEIEAEVDSLTKKALKRRGRF
jgi:hypothetical protein